MLEVADVVDGQVDVQVPEVPHTVLQFVMAGGADALLVAHSQLWVQWTIGDGQGLLVVDLVAVDFRLRVPDGTGRVNDREIDGLSTVNARDTLFWGGFAIGPIQVSWLLEISIRINFIQYKRNHSSPSHPTFLYDWLFYEESRLFLMLK